MKLHGIATALLLSGSVLALAACNTMGQPGAAQASRTQTQADRQAIAHIQGELQQLGYYAGPLDGAWGPESRAAMANFQQAKGLPASGQPDQASLNALAVAVPSAAPAATASAPPPAAAAPTQLPSIAQVQTELGQLGYYHGRVDGVWGRQTRSAMAAFQRSQGLRPTGQGDVRTMNALNAAMQASGAGGYAPPPAPGSAYR